MARGKLLPGLSFLFLLIMISIATAQEPEEGGTDSVVRIGLLCALSGPSSSAGRNFLEGLQTFFNHVNDIGGVHERNIVLLTQDHGDDPDQAVVAARQMQAAQGVLTLISTSGMKTTQALLDSAFGIEDFPVLVFGDFPRSLFFGFKRNVLPFGMPYGDQITLAVEYLLKRRPRMNPRMGLLSQNSSLGEEAREGFHRVVKHYGVEMVGEELYDPGTFDFAPFLNRLWSAQADHVVLGTTTREASQIMLEAVGMNWFPQFVGTSLTAEPEILVEAGEGAEGYLVVDYLAKPWEKVPGVTLMGGNTQKYYPRKDTNALHRYHILGYVSGLLVGEGLRLAGRELTREAFIEVLGRIHGLNTNGLAGTMWSDPGSPPTLPMGRVFRFDRVLGRFLPLTDWAQPLVKAAK